jgi:hypothetical protein
MLLCHGGHTTQVPLLWNRSPEAAAAKLSSVASALGVDAPAAAGLYMAVPTLASINMPGVVRDRVEAVSDALGVTCAKVREGGFVPLHPALPLCPGAPPGGGRAWRWQWPHWCLAMPEGEGGWRYQEWCLFTCLDLFN